MAQEDKILKDAPFDVQPFDEKEYIRKELISFKTTLVLFMFSIVTAGLSYFIWQQKRDLLFLAHILISMAIAFGLLRYLFRAAKIDIAHWKRKEWTGTYLLYFFFWLGFFLLFVNPPITDAAPPVTEFAVSPAVQAPGGTIELGAYIADNVGVDRDSIVFCIAPKQEATLPAIEDLQSRGCGPEWTKPGGDPFWQASFTSAEAGDYWWVIQAEDESGQVTRHNGTLQFADPFRVVEPPRDNSFVVSSDALRVRVQDDLRVRAVQFSLDDGQTWTNFARDPDEGRAAEGWWVTDAGYQGWTRGSHSVEVRAALQPQFLTNGHRVDAGFAVDPDGPYNVTVAEQLQIVGEREPPTFNEAEYRHPGRTPGLEFPIVVAAVAGFALLRRRP